MCVCVKWNWHNFLPFLICNTELNSHGGSLFFVELKESIFFNKSQDSGIPGKWCKMEENKYFGKCKVSLSGEGLKLNEAGAGLLCLISLVICCEPCCLHCNNQNALYVIVMIGHIAPYLKFCSIKCLLKAFWDNLLINQVVWAFSYLLGYHRWCWFCHSSTRAARLHPGILRGCNNSLQCRTRNEPDRSQHPSGQTLLASIYLEHSKLIL